MKQLITLLTMVCGLAMTGFAQTAKITESITLADGDSIVPYDYYEKAYETKILPQERALAEKYYNIVISDPVLRSRNLDKTEYAEETVIGAFEYSYSWTHLESLYYDLYNVLKIKAVRKVVP